MKSNEMQKFHIILEESGKIPEDFCKEVGIPLSSFQVQTVSTKKTPKWIKAFLYGNKIKSK
jgi:hypothetical protein